jgi:hypothetical protein
MSYLFELPIGDWSDDGHGKCDYFTIQSNVPMEEIKKILPLMQKEFGILDFFSEYEEASLSDYEFEKLIEKLPEAEELFDTDNYIQGTDSAAELFILAMKAYDPSLELEIRNTPILYEASFGYGLFD